MALRWGLIRDSLWSKPLATLSTYCIAIIKTGCEGGGGHWRRLQIWQLLHGSRYSLTSWIFCSVGLDKSRTVELVGCRVDLKWPDLLVLFQQCCTWEWGLLDCIPWAFIAVHRCVSGGRMAAHSCWPGSGGFQLWTSNRVEAASRPLRLADPAAQLTGCGGLRYRRYSGFCVFSTMCCAEWVQRSCWPIPAYCRQPGRRHLISPVLRKLPICCYAPFIQAEDVVDKVGEDGGPFRFPINFNGSIVCGVQETFLRNERMIPGSTKWEAQQTARMACSSSARSPIFFTSSPMLIALSQSGRVGCLVPMLSCSCCWMRTAWVWTGWSLGCGVLANPLQSHSHPGPVTSHSCLKGLSHQFEIG
jgi:hypothetical protein